MARARAHRACAVARRLRWPEWIPASAEAVGASAFSESEGFVQICPEGSAHCYSECHFLPAVPRPPTGNSQRRSGANRVRLAPTSDGKHGWLRAGRERKRHFALSCARPARRVAVARGTCDLARQHVAIVRRPGKKHPAWREYSRILRVDAREALPPGILDRGSRSRLRGSTRLGANAGPWPLRPRVPRRHGSRSLAWRRCSRSRFLSARSGSAAYFPSRTLYRTRRDFSHCTPNRSAMPRQRRLPTPYLLTPWRRARWLSGTSA